LAMLSLSISSSMSKTIGTKPLALSILCTQRSSATHSPPYDHSVGICFRIVLLFVSIFHEPIDTHVRHATRTTSLFAGHASSRVFSNFLKLSIFSCSNICLCKMLRMVDYIKYCSETSLWYGCWMIRNWLILYL
jgi:hypothetical protein